MAFDMTGDTLEMGIRGRKAKVIPLSENPLWAKWGENDSKLRELEIRLKYTSGPTHGEAWPIEARALIAECHDRLDRAHALLQRRLRWVHRWSGGDLIYRLLHQVDEDLVLLMSRDEFAGKLMSVKDDFERNVHDPLLKRTWLSSGCLEALVRRYVPEGQPGSAPAAPGAHDEEPTPHGRGEASLRRDQHLLRTAMGILNESVDRDFWRLAMNMRIQIANTAMFIVVVAGAAIFAATVFHGKDAAAGGAVHRGALPWLWLGLLTIIGASGAVISNMLASREFVIPYGHAAIAFLFYCFVIPIVGAVAAAFVYAIEQSGLVFRFPIDMTSKPWAQVVVAVMAGFFGERVLRSTMESVFQKLFGKATKEKSAAS